MGIFSGQVNKLSLIHWATVLLMVGSISGCGDDAFTGDSDGAATSTTSSTSGAGTDDGTTVEIGSGTGASFSAGTLNIAANSLAAGGATTISVTLQQSTGVLYTDSASITFSSGCTAQGLATLDATVTTTTGVAVSNYAATGCSGSDTITASATINGSTISASGSLTVAEASLGSIQFISATPELIALQGTGGAGLSENATLVFKVLDQTGGPVAGETVMFELNTTVGGLSITPESATSGADGTVQTTVLSGTIPTAVRVTATIIVDGGTNISTQSDQLVVSTGIPDQDSFSLSATEFNPEGLNYDGETVTITARLADRFNNPVPDGTAVSFTTEGGSIEGSCLTAAGACSVIWTSQNPRPCGQQSSDANVAVTDDEELVVVLNPSAGPNVCEATDGTTVNANLSSDPQGKEGLGQPFGGRATIIATAVGEESFIDVNGNGVFDDGDFFTDLPEVWRDDDESEERDSHEIFLDFNKNGTYDAADNAFNGVLCSRTVSPGCGTSTTLHIRQTLVLVMSGSHAEICIKAGSGLCDADINVANKGSETLDVIFSDVHNQPLPAGTTVSTACTIGSVTNGDVTVQSTNYNGPLRFSFNFKGAGSEEGDEGTCTVTVTTPNGNVSPSTINVTEAAPPPPP